jgi:modulator of FtsH protease HflC
MKSNKLTIIIGIVTLALVLVVMCTYQLKVDKVAIVTSLGKPKVISQPGLYFRLPWPAQKLVKLDRRRQLLSIPERDTVTDDDINLIVKMFVSWSLAEGDENALKFYSSIGESAEDAERNLKELVESNQEVIIRKYKLADFLGSGGNTKNEEIERELKVLVNKKTLEKYGIVIHQVSISRLSLHEKNSASVLKKMQEEQLKKAVSITSLAMKNSKIKKNSANEEAAKLIASAEADAKKTRAEVLVKSTELFEKYQNDQDFALFMRKLDAIRETTNSKTTFLINPTIPPFDLFKTNEASKKDQK